MANKEEKQEKRKYMPLNVAQSMNNFFAVYGDKDVPPVLALYAAREAVDTAPGDASWYVQGVIPFLSNQTIRNGEGLSDAALDFLNSYGSVFANGAQLSTIYEVLKSVGYEGYIPNYLNGDLTLVETEKAYEKDENRGKAVGTVISRLRENTRTKLYNRVASDSLQGLEKKIAEAQTPKAA